MVSELIPVDSGKSLYRLLVSFPGKHSHNPAPACVEIVSRREGVTLAMHFIEYVHPRSGHLWEAWPGKEIRPLPGCSLDLISEGYEPIIKELDVR